MPVKKGSKVKIEYKGTLDNGTVFDSSEKYGKLLEFEVGAGQVIPGFESAVMGMSKGEEKEITLEPSEAYGEPNPKLVKDVPRSQFPKDQEIKAGMMLLIGLPNGKRIPAKISKVTPETVTIDLNHPLAGKRLNFKFKLIEIS